MNENSLSIPHGASAITEVFERRKAQGGKSLVAYIMAGDPDLGTTEKIIRALSGIDVDIIELGVPFSDPLADGPVIQEAAQRSLRQGVNLHKIFDMVRDVRLTVDTPILLMTYYNLFWRYGLETFTQDAAGVGIDGVIVPDLPAEEAAPFRQALEAEGLAFVPLVAPTSTDERIHTITHEARGFIYYISRTGVTGEQKSISADLAENVGKIRQNSSLPIAVGFGISTPEQAKTVSEHADGVVMGSAIVRLIHDTPHLHERVVAKFLRPFVDSLHGNAESQ